MYICFLLCFLLWRMNSLCSSKFLLLCTLRSLNLELKFTHRFLSGMGNKCCVAFCKSGYNTHKSRKKIYFSSFQTIWPYNKSGLRIFQDDVLISIRSAQTISILRHLALSWVGAVFAALPPIRPRDPGDPAERGLLPSFYILTIVLNNVVICSPNSPGSVRKIKLFLLPRRPSIEFAVSISQTTAFKVSKRTAVEAEEDRIEWRWHSLQLSTLLDKQTSDAYVYHERKL